VAVLVVRARRVNEYPLNFSEIYPDSLTWSECSPQHLLAGRAAARIRY